MIIRYSQRNNKVMKLCYLIVALSISIGAMAQETPQDKDKMLRENIDKTLERYEKTLELEYWQVFYMDSILTHDYSAMMAELEEKSKAKVENSTIYQKVQDKWNEQIYNSIHKILNEEQWNKYLKQGAAREKKARDKREEKRNKK
ncbi:MAG TPA: hypothetical protein DHU75_02590 [Rikenellaceae bacterium]|nr:hypothetical protein [Rikenellaceae bacterium]